MKTQCPVCLDKWTGELNDINKHDRRCEHCEPRKLVVPEDVAMIDWIQISPNPRLRILYDSWCQNVGGVSLRGTLRWLLKYRYENI